MLTDGGKSHKIKHTWCHVFVYLKFDD